MARPGPILLVCPVHRHSLLTTKWQRAELSDWQWYTRSQCKAQSSSMHSQLPMQGRTTSSAHFKAPRPWVSAPVQASRCQKAARRGRVSVVVRADGDYYSLLGVDKGADKKTIKQAYRQKARKFHPVSGRPCVRLRQQRHLCILPSSYAA